MTDSRTGLTLGSINSDNFQKPWTMKQVEKALQPMILSASGWRKVFAESGEEEDFTEKITSVDSLLSGAMAKVFSSFLKNKKGIVKPRIALALDARPTGPEIASAMLPVFIAEKVYVEYLFIASAPEAMSYAKVNPAIDGFVYVSASHNPIGHNGVKFGLNSGGVLGADDVKGLIQDYKALLADEEQVTWISSILKRDYSEILAQSFANSSKYKEQSLKAYSDFSAIVYSQDEKGFKTPWMIELQKALESRPLGILGELNGSARGVTIDKDFLSTMGINIELLNDTPREVVHRIVPEGRSLDLCREELEKLFIKENHYLLGYVPDNDGDRGNIAAIDPKSGKADILEAQEVFALSLLSTLAEEEYKIQRGWTKRKKTAVVVNGPTSSRVEDICEAFGVEVFRAEVGEANVTGKAAALIQEGYHVPILGEGSNGGNITNPAQVRDPLNTLGALIKLLRLGSAEEGSGLFEIWCEKSGQAGSYKQDYCLKDVVDTLPAYVTTSAYEDRALMQISSKDHKQLKIAYEEAFLLSWEERKEELLRKWSIEGWEEINYEGGETKFGFGPKYRSGAHKGGLKIQFYDTLKKPIAYMWMRGSGTEPVFRVLVDAKGRDPKMEAELLEWHRSLIEIADARIS